MTNLDSKNRNLWESYDQIIEEFLDPEFTVYPTEDYFRQFTMPEEFLNSDTFHNIKSFFDKKFSGVGLATDEDKGCQGQPRTQEVVKQYRQQLQDMMTALEDSSGKYQEAIAKLEKLKTYWSEREQQ
ncbi:hypothetical protein B9S53_23030 [Arthrospira sp. O9.13F]|nr:hypothetical protein B9S53_23030 [Arthrospira sp. O9.13F]